MINNYNEELYQIHCICTIFLGVELATADNLALRYIDSLPLVSSTYIH